MIFQKTITVTNEKGSLSGVVEVDLSQLVHRVGAVVIKHNVRTLVDMASFHHKKDVFDYTDRAEKLVREKLTSMLDTPDKNEDADLIIKLAEKGYA